MPFYYLMIDGRGLTIPDGSIGFIANRYVFARSEQKAEDLVRRRIEEDWTSGRYSGLSAQSPRVEVLEVYQVSISTLLRNWRQNRAHAFYEVDD